MPNETGSLAGWALRNARKIVVAVVGATFIGLGVLMLFLPGPGLVTVFVGLTILAAEFAWARRWLRRAREAAGDAASRVRRGRWDRGDGPDRPPDAAP